MIVETILLNGKLHPRNIVEKTKLDQAAVKKHLQLLLTGNFIKHATASDQTTLSDRHMNEEAQAIAQSSEVPLSSTEMKKLMNAVKGARSVALEMENNKRKLRDYDDDNDWDDRQSKKTKSSNDLFEVRIHIIDR